MAGIPVPEDVPLDNLRGSEPQREAGPLVPGGDPQSPHPPHRPHQRHPALRQRSMAHPNVYRRVRQQLRGHVRQVLQGGRGSIIGISMLTQSVSDFDEYTDD
eukprot:140711-Prorocentrum_minimum.AAC.9